MVSAVRCMAGASCLHGGPLAAAWRSEGTAVAYMAAGISSIYLPSRKNDHPVEHKRDALKP